ncbi:hypothetical protein SALBM311S_07182 [Streptomyces alboniger]
MIGAPGDRRTSDDNGLRGPAGGSPRPRPVVLAIHRANDTASGQGARGRARRRRLRSSRRAPRALRSRPRRLTACVRVRRAPDGERHAMPARRPGRRPLPAGTAAPSWRDRRSRAGSRTGIVDGPEDVRSPGAGRVLGGAGSRGWHPDDARRRRSVRTADDAPGTVAPSAAAVSVSTSSTWTTSADASQHRPGREGPRAVPGRSPWITGNQSQCSGSRAHRPCPRHQGRGHRRGPHATSRSCGSAPAPSGTTRVRRARSPSRPAASTAAVSCCASRAYGPHRAEALRNTLLIAEVDPDDSPRRRTSLTTTS